MSPRRYAGNPGGERNYKIVTPFLREYGLTADVSGGLRYVNLSETMSVSSYSVGSHSDQFFFEPALGLPFGNPRSTTQTTDVVKARNNFIGPQFGANVKYACGA
jgi:hypothetical protein